MLRPLLIFALVVTAAWGFREFWTTPPEVFLKQSTTTADVPKANTYMLDTETRQFDQQGNLAYRLTTDKSEHFTSAKRFVLEQPKITAFYTDTLPWTLSSRQGVVENSGEQISLTGDVEGRQTQKSGEDFVLQTSKLLFYPEKKFAETDKPVTITTPSVTSTGTGMKADLSTEQFELLSNVRTTLHAK